MPVITDFDAMLRRPAFWSAYYGGRVADSEDENGAVFLDRVLGADPDFDQESLWGPDPYDVITDEMDNDEEDRAMNAAMAAGAVLRLPFPSGYTWSIRFSSSPGIYHGLSTPDGADRISLGYDDPHFHLPILRWSEALQIAASLGRYPTPDEPTSFPAEFILPLLAPVTWATSPDEAVAAERDLAEVWAATGMISPGDAAELAARLVLHASDLVWRPDPVRGWANNGRHSHRNPAAGSWSPDEFAVFRRFLDSLDTHSTTTSTAPAHAGAAQTVATMRWRFDADGPIEPALAVNGGQVYCFTSADAKLRALDAATGRERWHTGVMSRGFGRNTVAVSDGTVYYAGGSQGLDLVAFAEHASGEAGAEWIQTADADRMRFTPSGAYSGWADTTPVVADGRVFVTEESLYTWQLTSSGPQPGWNGYLPGLSTPRSRPVVVGDRVYVAVGDDYRNANTVQVFDIATGERIRRLVSRPEDPFPEYEEIEVAGTAQDLAAHGDTLFVAADALTALDAATGWVRWSVVTERQWSGAIGVTDEWVVGTTCRLASKTRTAGPEWQYSMVGVDRRRREVVWTFTAPERLASRGVVVSGRTAYSVGYDDRDATLYAVDLTSGELRWQYPLGRSTCLPAVADETVYVSTVDGALLAVGC
jgi:outer membrane protein assembly factor BamB